MQILSIQDLKKEFAGVTLFEHVSFAMNDNDRVALIGNNGSGKSTLLKMILGKEEITKGIIALAKGTRIGYLSQDVIENSNNTLYEEARHVFDDLIEKEEELNRLTKELENNPTSKELMDLYGRKQQHFASIGGYDYLYKIDMLLSKFGFTSDDYNRKITSFSGGERTKIAFAKLLLIEPELLVLDEPTNHLDLSTIEWLETYLKTYNGALLFVSHDRYFIDALCNKILEIENKTSFSFKGNYEDFIEEKKVLYESQLRAYENQQKEIERMKRFIEYFRYKPRFVSRVHDREKKLEHLKIIDKPMTQKQTMKIHFQGESLEGKEILNVEHLYLGFDNALVEDINFTVFGQNRIAIMGDNGSGKTTLLRIIMEDLLPLKGEIHFKRLVKIGYVDQHHFDVKGNETILENLLNEFPTLGEKALRNHLGKFNFCGDDYLKTLDMLSGGEKMRLILAKIILRNYDMLLLDEPTNHLDMVTRQALINALKEYKGTILFVSHDRFFVDELASHLLYFKNGKSYFNIGCYQDFKEIEQKLNLEAPKRIEKSNNVVKTEVKKSSFSPLKLEEKIRNLEKEIKELKDAQFLEENYMDYKKMAKIEKQIEEKEKELLHYEELYLL